MDLALSTYQVFAGRLPRPMESQLSDGEVVRDVLRGNRDSFRRLVQRYERPIYTLCVRMVRDAHEAEDCAQTAFLKAYSELSSFHLGRSFRTWLYRIATNVCIDALRRAQVRPAEPSVEEPRPEEFGDRQPDPRQEASFSEMRRLVRGVLDGLDDKYRLPMVLFYMEGLECTEIAAMLRLRLGTVKTRMRRGRLMLRETMTRRWPELALQEVEPL